MHLNLDDTGLDAAEKNAVKMFNDALHGILGENLLSVILYGSAVREDFRPGKSNINLLILVRETDLGMLKKCLDPVFRGRRYGIAPFFLTEEDLKTSADVFPIKFLSIRESYRLLSGADLLKSLVIRREHLRLRCEQEVKNLLLRLRRHYLMTGGRKLSEMMSRTVGGFLENLRVIISLSDGELPPREETIAAATATLGLAPEILVSVHSLREMDVSLPQEEAEALYDGFLKLVDDTARYADQLM